MCKFTLSEGFVTALLIYGPYTLLQLKYNKIARDYFTLFIFRVLLQKAYTQNQKLLTNLGY